MVKKKIFRKMRKFFILPLFILCLFSCILCVNADSLIYQSNPFIIQGTATDNGESIADVSPVAFLFEKRGHSEVVNNEIVNADGQYLVNIGRQQWDEEWELGYIGGNGLNVNSSTNIRSKNYIRVVSGSTYYRYCGSVHTFIIYGYDDNKDYVSILANYGGTGSFTIPSSVSYIRFFMDDYYGNEYLNDITFSLYYEDEDGYDEYYPYTEVSRVDTGNEVLRSAGSVYDVKNPDGTITRNVGSVDLGTLSWTYFSSGDEEYFYANNILNFKKYDYNGTNMLCSKYILSPTTYGNMPDGSIRYFSSNVQILIKDTSYTDAATFTSAMSGVYLNYELAESTTEQGTSYSQNYYVDDFGSQYWLNSEEEFVEVGQAGLYGYNFDFVYSWYDNIVRMIVAPIKSLGGSIVNFVKTGFVQLFTTQEVVNDVVVYHASPIAWFTFALMGIALAMSLTYFLVNLLRRSK